MNLKNVSSIGQHAEFEKMIGKVKNNFKILKNEADVIENKTSIKFEDMYASYSVKDGGKACYTAYESENYKITPDNNNERLMIYDNKGNKFGPFYYKDIIINRDKKYGNELLISKVGQPVILNDELKQALCSVTGKKALDTVDLTGYTIKVHPGTGIQYLQSHEEEGKGGNILIHNDEEHAKYMELAKSYLEKYPKIIDDMKDAIINASFDIRGMQVQTKTGILSMTYDSISYYDEKNPSKNWHMTLSGSDYRKLMEQFENNKLQGLEEQQELEDITMWLDILGRDKEDLDQYYYNKGLDEFEESDKII